MRIDDLSGRRIAVWGVGVEGRAALRFLVRHTRASHILAVVDHPTAQSSIEVEPGRTIALVSSAEQANTGVLDRVDVVVKSPGVSPYHGNLAALIRRRPNIAVTGGTQLWFAEAAANGGLTRTIGVTGSKGKSTTASLTAHLLAGIGLPCTLAGNVGRAPLDLLDDALTLAAATAVPTTGEEPPSTDEWTVLELSSFQSSEVAHSPRVGVLTALFPEHLDWHESTERYYQDKLNLFAHGVSATVANLANDDVAKRAAQLPHLRAYGTPDSWHVGPLGIVRADGELTLPHTDSPLRGQHNALNICAAITALEGAGLSVTSEELRRIVGSFKPLAHRLEPVGDVEGRLVIDDSLSTAPQAAVAALAAFSDRAVSIILGGHDRGLDYGALVDALAWRNAQDVVTYVAAVPESGARIVELIAQRMPAGSLRWEFFDEFDDAVDSCRRTTPVGGVILLSPAAPSFGRFVDYRERGLHFRERLGIVPVTSRG